MGVIVITPPEPLVTPAEVRARLGVDEDEGKLTGLIGAACAAIEPPFGWTGRAFGRQTLELRRNNFPYDYLCGFELVIPCPPVVSVESVTYTDLDGADVVLDASAYVLRGGGGALTRLAPLYGTAWPGARFDGESVRVRYTAGYEPGDAALEPVREAVYLTISHLLSLGKSDLFLRREEVAGVGSQEWILSDVAGKVIDTAIQQLLWRYRVDPL